MKSFTFPRKTISTEWNDRRSLEQRSNYICFYNKTILFPRQLNLPNDPNSFRQKIVKSATESLFVRKELPGTAELLQPQ